MTLFEDLLQGAKIFVLKLKPPPPPPHNHRASSLRHRTHKAFTVSRHRERSCAAFRIMFTPGQVYGVEFFFR